jgi:hypothetical protein
MEEGPHGLAILEAGEPGGAGGIEESDCGGLISLPKSFLVSVLALARSFSIITGLNQRGGMRSEPGELRIL